MNNENSILTIGSIALDTIYTKNAHRENILGGSASYFSIAASYFRRVNVLGVVGNDFPKKYWDLYKKYNSVAFKNLEDLKENPRKTIPALCKWMGVRCGYLWDISPIDYSFSLSTS